jgi:hypothetical protein
MTGDEYTLEIATKIAPIRGYSVTDITTYFLRRDYSIIIFKAQEIF